MAAAAAMLLAAPLLRARPAGAARGSHALEVYRLQLAELDADIARGALMEAEAEAARLEIQRRMLAAAQEAEAAPAEGVRQFPVHYLAVGLALIVPLAAFSLYLLAGNPGLAPNSTQAQVTGADEEHLDMTALTAQLAARLQKSSDDIQGWMLLGRSFMNLGDTAKSVEAYRKALALTEGKPAPMVLAEFAEALVNSGDGQVGEEAATAFHRVLEIMPGEPRARFYLALQRAQSGDVKGAIDDWVALIKSAPPGAPWVAGVRAQVTEAAKQLNLDLLTLLPPETPVAGPAKTDIQAAEQMPDGERNAMIENMVARLAERLKTKEPGNVDGWLKLANAYGVLGRTKEQLEALAHAAEAGPERLDVLDAYADALQSAGESKRAELLWRRMLGLLPAGSEEYENISQKITEINTR